MAATRSDQRAELTRTIAELDRKLANLIELAASTGSATVAARIRELEAQLSTCRAQLEAVSAPVR